MWSFGDDDSLVSTYTWYRANTTEMDEDNPHRVGVKAANPWGLHDMHGNVSEWVQDGYSHNYAHTTSVSADGQNHDIGIVRGGAFPSDLLGTRSAMRGGPITPDSRIIDIGARVVLHTKTP